MVSGALAQDGQVRVAVKTSKGMITLVLEAAKAPLTTRNFLRYVDAKLYDKSTFYRVSHVSNAPGTATADFFIVVGDQPGFDADPSGQGDKDGFAAFGQVVEGMDLVHAIMEMKVSPTAGVGAMKGEMLSPPVPIISMRRI